MRKFTKAVVFTVTVLVSYLISGAIEERVFAETEQFRPLTATLLGMAVIVLVFVPVFTYTERLTEWLVVSSLKQSRQQGGRVLGVIACTMLIAIILVALYLNRWFQQSLLDVIPF
jgi:hypothetical protein